MLFVGGDERRAIQSAQDDRFVPMSRHFEPWKNSDFFAVEVRFGLYRTSAGCIASSPRG
jgi:hypothetical protein